jgi:ribosomal protein L11 methyltransferase
MSYTAWHFTVHPPQPGSEILMACIGELGFDTFQTTDAGFTAWIDAALSDQVQLEEFTFEDFTYSVKKETVETINWNEEWEKNFQPVQVGDAILIRAHFHAPIAGVKHDIIITPKMSFGTGHHQTTRLVCAEILKLDLKNQRVLDMGCGTGVLAILAAQCGASEVVGIDIDEWSVENARENCQRNHASEIELHMGDAALLTAQAPFDIIFANINKNILKRDMSAYAAVLKPGGTLLFSGFFTTDVEELIAVGAQNNLSFQVQHNEAEWAMVRMQKR